MVGKDQEGAGSPLLFTLAWPWMSKKSGGKESFSADESGFANFGQDNATVPFFKNELELLEYAVTDNPKSSTAEEVLEERPLPARPSGSVMRAILRDELYRAVTDSTTSSAVSGAAAVAAGRRLSVQFVDPQNRNSTLCVDIGRRVMWGKVDVKEFEREKEWNPDFEEQVSRIKQQHNGAELEAVYELLVDEFATEKPVFIITSGGQKFRATVCVTNQHQLVVKRSSTLEVEVTARVPDISSVRFGISKAYIPYLTKDENAHLNVSACLSISFSLARRRSGCGPQFVAVSQSSGIIVGLCFVFGTEAIRNSFGLLLRTMNRVVRRDSIGDWEDAIEELDTDTEETEEESSKRESLQQMQREGPTLPASVNKSSKMSTDKVRTASQQPKEEVDLPRLTQCLSALATGMEVKKVTKKGTFVTRKLCLAGVNLQLFSLKGSKGQVVGVFDDVVSTEAGQDDPCFQLMKAKQPLPDASLCAVVKLSDHSFALIFKFQQQRDNFVYAMTHLHESDEVLKYL